jgi:anti-sigma B factor antagonist
VNKEGWAKKRQQPKLPISIEARGAGRVAVLDVAGRVTLGESSKELGKHIREAVEAGHNGVLVNMARVTYIDSSGIGELVSAFSKIRKAGGQLILAGVSKELSYLFHVANLDRILEIVPDEAAALEKFNKPPQEAQKA